MNLAYRSAGGALAIALYVGAFFILSAPEVISAGDAVADGDAGYDINTTLGAWTTTTTCDSAEGGSLVFYAAMR